VGKTIGKTGCGQMVIDNKPEQAVEALDIGTVYQTFDWDSVQKELARIPETEMDFVELNENVNTGTIYAEYQGNFPKELVEEFEKLYTIVSMVILVFIVGCNVNENHAESTESISQGGVQRVNVIAVFDGGEFADKMDLLIMEINTYKEGTLYELKLDYNKDFYGRYDSRGGDKWEGEWDRLHLSCFFIEGNMSIGFGKQRLMELSRGMYSLGSI